MCQNKLSGCTVSSGSSKAACLSSFNALPVHHGTQPPAVGFFPVQEAHSSVTTPQFTQPRSNGHMVAVSGLEQCSFGRYGGCDGTPRLQRQGHCTMPAVRHIGATLPTSNATPATTLSLDAAVVLDQNALQRQAQQDVQPMRIDLSASVSRREVDIQHSSRCHAQAGRPGEAEAPQQQDPMQLDASCLQIEALQQQVAVQQQQQEQQQVAVQQQQEQQQQQEEGDEEAVPQEGSLQQEDGVQQQQEQQQQQQQQEEEAVPQETSLQQEDGVQQQQEQQRQQRDEEENEKAMPQESSLQQEDGVPQGPRGSHLWEKAVNPGGVAVQEDAQQQQLSSQLQEEAVQVDAVEQQQSKQIRQQGWQQDGVGSNRQEIGSQEGDAGMHQQLEGGLQSDDVNSREPLKHSDPLQTLTPTAEEAMQGKTVNPDTRLESASPTSTKPESMTSCLGLEFSASLRTVEAILNGQADERVQACPEDLLWSPLNCPASSLKPGQHHPAGDSSVLNTSQMRHAWRRHWDFLCDQDEGGLPLGTRIAVRYDNEPTPYKGTVTGRKDGGTYEIHFDTGDTTDFDPDEGPFTVIDRSGLSIGTSVEVRSCSLCGKGICVALLLYDQ